MRRTHIRIAGVAAALLAAAVAGFSLRPTPKATTVLAARPAEVRTQVIHRTIHIVRHKHARARHVTVAPSAPAVASGTVATGAPVRTSSSHLAAAAGSTAAVTTRTSAGHGTSSAGGTVTTRSSTSAGGGSVTTRSSGGGEHEDGGGGDN